MPGVLPCRELPHGRPGRGLQLGSACRVLIIAGIIGVIAATNQVKGVGHKAREQPEPSLQDVP